jgi:hypothetical protein
LWRGEAQKGSANYVTLRQNGKELSAAGNVQLELDKNQLKESGMIGVPMALSGSQNTGTLTARSDNLNSISNRITLFVMFGSRMGTLHYIATRFIFTLGKHPVLRRRRPKKRFPLDRKNGKLNGLRPPVMSKFPERSPNRNSESRL